MHREARTRHGKTQCTALNIDVFFVLHHHTSGFHTTQRWVFNKATENKEDRQTYKAASKYLFDHTCGSAQIISQEKVFLFLFFKSDL